MWFIDSSGHLKIAHAPYDQTRIDYVGSAANVTGIGLMIFGPIERNLNLIRQYPRLI